MVRCKSVAEDKIIAVALLTQRDLEVIGTGLGRVFPVEEVEGFEDLLAQLEHVEPTQLRAN